MDLLVCRASQDIFSFSIWQKITEPMMFKIIKVNESHCWHCYKPNLALLTQGVLKANLLTLGCGEERCSIYRKVPSKGMGNKAQIHSTLVVELGVFLKGKSRGARINHLVTFLWHVLITVSGIRMSLIYNPLVRWSMAWGSASSSCPEETTRVCTLRMMSTCLSLVLMMLSTTAVLVIWFWVISV